MEELLRDAYIAWADCESDENFKKFEGLRLAYVSLHGEEATEIILSELGMEVEQ